MISTRLVAAALALIAIPAAAFIAVPAGAAPLVVRAIGPSAAAYKPGQRLPEKTPLLLKAGDRITVLDARGTRSFTGPGSFRLDTASTTATPAGFTELLTQKSERRARIGAVRGPGAEKIDNPTPPGIWAIDAGRTATVCILDPTKLSLWRADPMAAGTVTVVRGTGGTPSTVTYAPGQAVANWPAVLPVADQDRFRTTGAGAPATLTVKKLQPAPSIDALAAAFLDAGCTSQFERLAAATKLDRTP